MGTPEKSHLSRNLFSMYRRYDSLMYCGRLTKKANCGVGVGSCVAYFIRMYLPLVEAGG